MTPTSSLRKRIAAAYLLFALGSSILFAVMAALAVEGIEVHLVDNRLEEVAAWAGPRHAAGLSVAMPAGLSFHHGVTIPLSLRDMAAGVHEKHVDGVGLHVLAGKDATGDYVVVDHESDYEKVELVVYSMFALGFVGFLLFSLFLGRFIGRRVVTPITELAGAVRDGAPTLPLLDRTDELGVLARAFAAHTGELREFLARERFFTGDVSHELRTPLTVITGAAEILIEQSRGQPALAAPAERILRAANEAADSVNVLLMLARAPERIPRPATSIGAIAQLDTARYQPLVVGKPVQLEFAGGDDFLVSAPPELCAAAIGNLVRNACLYTSQGTVTVRLHARSVLVEDTGPGLPEAVRAMLLSGPMPRGATGSAGTGLGLALVKRICEQLGATLTLEDRPEGGSRFSIAFPVILTKS